MGEWENGRMGEWENGRMGEWENGRLRDYKYRAPNNKQPHGLDKRGNRISKDLQRSQ